MFDNVYMSADIPVPDFVQREIHEPVEWFGIIFCPIYKRGVFVEYKGEFKNLLVRIHGNKLSIRNSFHKFYSNENYSDFRFADFIEVANGIASQFDLTPQHFKIYKFEFGFNLEMSNNPEQIYNAIAGYKSTTVAPMLKNATEYGKKIVLTDYEIKVYNKTYEHKQHHKMLLSQNYLRVEIAYKHTRKSPMINFLSDMMDTSILEQLFNLYIADIRQMEFIPEMLDLKDLTPRQRELIFAGKNADFWKVERTINTNTAKKKKQLYLNLTKNSDLSRRLVEDLTLKFAELTC